LLNILILTDTINGGGAEIQLLEEIKILCGFANICIISAFEIETNILPFQVKYLGNLSKDNKSKLLKLIEEFTPNITHLHNTWSENWYNFIHLISSQKIMTLHDYRMVCPTGWRVRPVEKTGCPKQSFFTCLKVGCLKADWRAETGASYFWWQFSSYLRRNVSAWVTANNELIKILKKENITNVHYLNLPMIEPPPLSVGKRERLVIFAGEFGAHKGIHRLLRTIKSVSLIDPAIRFILIGKGRLMDEVVLTIKGEQYENVRVLGALERSVLINFLGQASLVYLPSRWQENFNLVSREARIVGTPILVPNLGGFIGRIHVGRSEYYDPNLDDDSAQIIRMVNQESSMNESMLDRNDQLWTCSVDDYTSRIKKIYSDALLY
jgi:glycosyltransferase involved in cell wall biosynthesis